MKTTPSNQLASLAANYLHAFESSVSHMDDYDAFLQHLRKLIHGDSYLLGSAEIHDASVDEIVLPDFEALTASETIIPITNQSGNIGHLKYRGKRDEKAYFAEDLHLMGAISGLVAALSSQAQKYQQKAKATKLLKHLFDQIPLSVICFDQSVQPILMNQRAESLLDEDAVRELGTQAQSIQPDSRGKIAIHFECQERLIYAEGTQLELEDQSIVSAYVLTDLSDARNELYHSLELETYRAQSKLIPLGVFVFENTMQAGAAQQSMRMLSDALQVSSSEIYPYDAYTTVCIFPGQPYQSIKRRILQCMDSLSAGHTSGLRGSLGMYDVEFSKDQLPQEVLGQIITELKPLDICLVPEFVVYEQLSGVSSSLKLIYGHQCRIVTIKDIQSLKQCIASGHCEAAFIDLDLMSSIEMAQLSEYLSEIPHPPKRYHFTFKQPRMVMEAYQISDQTQIFQKPFDSNQLIRMLEKDFHFA